MIQLQLYIEQLEKLTNKRVQLQDLNVEQSNMLSKKKELLHPQELIFKKRPGSLTRGTQYELTFLKFRLKQYQWKTKKERDDLWNFIDNVKLELVKVSLKKLKPTQSGKDCLNSSSKAEAEEYKKVMDGTINVEDVREANYYPILADKNTWQILDGNHRHCALLLVGMKYAYVLAVDLPKQYL